MNMFTVGQKERMLATLNTARASVKNAIACNVVGVDEKDNSQIRVYPNPASKELTMAGIDKPVGLKLLSVFGQAIVEQKVAEGTTLNLSNYATGIYVLQLFDGEEILQQEKIIIAR